jgi:hypothetical protein
MVYSDVVRRGLILPYKAKYTIRDVHKVMTNSLFDRPRTWTMQEARFIVICSADRHNVPVSKTVSNLLRKQNYQYCIG